ncbi:DMT family transporter [Vibrio pectenicida]|uniref:DMT family transporter n=1 Tax=Vibrio pectenicida TaxID=62763 RepID=A0A3R9ECJ7_9VIBR|nr:DMT family transporter [Vibrio pectenicida]RSD27284.1 DMT family transporter [Vibrio pectenicida]
MKHLGWVFVFLWASGYIASSIGLNYSNPLSFITLRVIISLIFFIIVCLVLRSDIKELNKYNVIHSMLVGLLLQFLYPVFFSYSLITGISPTMLTIVLGLQPVLTLIISRDIKFKVQIYAVFGCVVGTLIFSAENFSLGTTNMENFSFAILSLLGVTSGTILQKKYCSSIPVESNMLMQCLSSVIVLIPTTLIISEFKFELNYTSVSALFWQAILISSLSSILLIRALSSGAVTNVSTYFSCVPAATALMTYFVFNSVINTNMLVGMIIIFGCTWLVQSSPKLKLAPQK